jgi:hypothetical protein
VSACVEGQPEFNENYIQTKIPIFKLPPTLHFIFKIGNAIYLLLIIVLLQSIILFKVFYTNSILKNNLVNDFLVIKEKTQKYLDVKQKKESVH